MEKAENREKERLKEETKKVPCFFTIIRALLLMFC